MTKWLDFAGKTEDEAIETGLKSLSLLRDDVSVEIIERAKSGFLGLGSSRAVVRLTFESAGETEQPKPVSAAKPVSAVKPVPAVKPVSASQNAKFAEVDDFVSGLLRHMGVKAELCITEREDGFVSVSLSGPSMGAVIGRRGETLDAIQHIANYAVNKGREPRLHISIDAENYRQKRDESLVSLAEKMAAKAVKYRRSMALEPMNSYERHVIHTALQDNPDVTTSSTGTEPRRRVVVMYTKGCPAGQNNPGPREWN